MYLINTSTLVLEEFIGQNIPKYAILSHRWETPKEEVSMKELRKGHKKETKGYKKIVELCRLARSQNLQWAWADTCCIDKKSSAELDEAVRSMFSYYRKASTCYVYLRDVETGADWRQSEWWSRGWTLQELIAPRDLIFLDRTWKPMGSKEELASKIARHTHIPLAVLINPDSSLRDCRVAEKFSWAAGRRTARVEDIAYCLLGLFRINMPLLYGEDKNAFRRLQLEIVRKYPDETIFAWPPAFGCHRHNVLAESPDVFARFRDVSKTPGIWLRQSAGRSIPCSINSWGIELRANARELVPKDGCIDLGREPSGSRWAVTLAYYSTSAPSPELLESDCTIVLIPSPRIQAGFQRTECHFGKWETIAKVLEKRFCIQPLEKDKLFRLQYDEDVVYDRTITQWKDSRTTELHVARTI